MTSEPLQIVGTVVITKDRRGRIQVRRIEGTVRRVRTVDAKRGKTENQ